MKLRYSYLPVLAGLALAPVSRSQDAPAAGDDKVKAEAAAEAAAEADGEAAPAKDEAKPYLGLSTSTVPGFLGKHINLKDGDGLLVRATDPDGPAAKAGIEVDDVITKLNGEALGPDASLAGMIKDMKPGDEVELDTIHLGKPIKAKFKLAPRPAHQAMEGVGRIEGGPDQPGIVGGNLLQGVPPELRKQIEKQMRDGMRNGGAMGLNIVPGEGGLKIVPPAGGDQNRGAFKLNVASNITVADGEGSVSLKKTADGTHARVLDREGKEVWSGPWETDQNKAAAPPDIRERISRANLNITPRFNLKHPAPKPREDKAPEQDGEPSE